VLGHALDAGRGLIIALNKWDGLERHERTAVERELDRRLDYVPFAPRVPISALHGSGLGELIKLVRKVHRSSYLEFTPSEITEVLQQAMDKVQPPLVKGRAAKFRYAHQGGRNPPRIIVHGNRLDTLPESYKRYLEHFVRDRYKLVGVPIRLEFRASKNPFEGKPNPLNDHQVKRKRRLLRHVKR
jgi:GTP-binding protein